MGLRSDRGGTHTAWWLVPIGIVFTGVGLVAHSDGARFGIDRLVVLGLVLVIAGVALGIRGQRFR